MCRVGASGTCLCQQDRGAPHTPLHSIRALSSVCTFKLTKTVLSEQCQTGSPGVPPMWRAAGLAHLQRHCPRAPSLSPNLTVVGARGQGPAALEGVCSGFQSAQLEPGFLRDTKLLQGILQQGGGGVRENSGSEALYPPTPTLPAGPNIHLACHLLDLTPIEDKAPAHELVAGEEVVSQRPAGS